MLISIIVPCFNEQESIPLFVKEIKAVEVIIKEKYKMEVEYLFIDDGSKDKTLETLENLSLENENIKYISFSRNFGKESAIYAGFENCKGDLVVMMDADLQDPPSLLPEMIGYILDGKYDSVATRRVDRTGEPPIRSFFARMFYKIINKISNAEIVDGARDYRLMTRQFVNALLNMKEYNRFSKGIFGWVGFKTKWIEFQNVERIAGETKWSFWKLFKYSLEGIIAFSTLPLQIASLFGILLFVLSIIMIIFIIFRTIMFGDPVAGWPSLVCLITFIGGVQLLSIGILGQYLSKTYLESKNRPIYIVKEKGRIE